ncbi:MAG: fatty acid desaturase, partial [Paracoccaceae bacterium]
MAQTNPFRIGDWLPFWSSFILFALGWFTVVTGGYSFLLVIAVVWYVVPILDQIMNKAKSNVDPETGENNLAPFVLITKIWPIFQFILIFVGLWIVEQRDDAFGLQMGVFFAIGMISGTVGINYSHELMHQKNKFERNMADVLLAMTLYSHFRSEHLLVHHRYVGTPRDPVTARYNEG